MTRSTYGKQTQQIVCTQRRRLVCALPAMASLAVFAGCASAPKPLVPVPLSIRLRASATINPDTRNRPSPLMVRIYELKSSASFEAADFFSLFERDQATLGPEFISREEVILKPGEEKLLSKKGNVETRAIGVLAAYRDLERSVWRAVATVPAPTEAGILSGTVFGGSKEVGYQVQLDQSGVKIGQLARS